MNRNSADPTRQNMKGPHTKVMTVFCISVFLYLEV